VWHDTLVVLAATTAFRAVTDAHAQEIKIRRIHMIGEMTKGSCSM
jgi:hypothetical protein